MFRLAASPSDIFRDSEKAGMSTEPVRVQEIPLPSNPLLNVRLTKNQQREIRLKEILDKRICDLGLTIESSPLHRFVQQLYRELERKKIMKFRPVCYLSD